MRLAACGRPAAALAAASRMQQPRRLCAPLVSPMQPRYGRELALDVQARDGKKRRKPQQQGGSGSFSEEEAPQPAPRRVDPNSLMSIRLQQKWVLPCLWALLPRCRRQRVSPDYWAASAGAARHRAYLFLTCCTPLRLWLLLWHTTYRYYLTKQTTQVCQDEQGVRPGAAGGVPPQAAPAPGLPQGDGGPRRIPPVGLTLSLQAAD